MTINYSDIKKCRICESFDLFEVINLGNQPLANNLQLIQNSETKKYPLILCKCNNCDTLQLSIDVNPEILFREYVWVTGTSQVTKDYSIKFFTDAVKYLEKNNELVIEIASNDGTFLKQFQSKGFNVLGVDPAENIAKLANESGIRTLPQFFNSEKSKEIRKIYGEAGLVFARNVIPHVPDAKDIISGIANCLKKGGIGIIEFHRADIILKELHYDSIYHEHFFYYSIKTLTNLLNQYNLYPFDIGESPISGGSYVLYFSNIERDKTLNLKNSELNEKQLGLEDLNSLIKFKSRVEKHCFDLKEILCTFKKQGKKIIAYGASARSSTLLNFCKISTDTIDLIIDQSKYKHGLFTAGTKIPIKSPEDGMQSSPDVILVLAWNFKDEIIEQLRSKWNWSGEIIIPLPGDPEILKI